MGCGREVFASAFLLFPACPPIAPPPLSPVSIECPSLPPCNAAHMAFGSLALLPLMLCHESYRGKHANVIRRDWRALFFIGLVNGPQIALNNASLVKIELSLNQELFVCLTNMRIPPHPHFAAVDVLLR